MNSTSTQWLREVTPPLAVLVHARGRWVSELGSAREVLLSGVLD